MSSRSLVCVIDDDDAVCKSIGNLVRSAGFQAETFASAQQFLQRYERVAPGCLILDVQMPGLSGLELQQELVRFGAHIPIIFISGQGDIPTSVRAMKAGAVEFLTKPFRDDDLIEAVEQALAHRRALAPGGPRVANIVGDSPALHQVLESVAAAAPTDCTVLICGETGTGKELVARAVHAMSPRASSAFVKLNCAAIPATLMESELFGHERGAFTDAVAQRIGRFELAQGGTIFLDEIGELALALQPKLLRVLQEREFERLGGTKTFKTDARLVAATNVNLAERAAAGEFRPDLFYRLNVFPVVVPPLRARREDIPHLVKHFIEKHAGRMGKRIEGVAPATMQALVDHSWPGNVRELEHFVERSVILSRGAELAAPVAELTRSSGPPPVAPAVAEQAGTDAGAARRTSPLAAVGGADAAWLTRKAAEREHVLRTLEETGWVISGPSGAAVRLGMKRTTLQTLVKRLGLERPRWGGRPGPQPGGIR